MKKTTLAIAMLAIMLGTAACSSTGGPQRTAESFSGWRLRHYAVVEYAPLPQEMYPDTTRLPVPAFPSDTDKTSKLPFRAPLCTAQAQKPSSSLLRLKIYFSL